MRALLFSRKGLLAALCVLAAALLWIFQPTESDRIKKRMTRLVRLAEYPEGAGLLSLALKTNQLSEACTDPVRFPTSGRSGATESMDRRGLAALLLSLYHQTAQLEIGLLYCQVEITDPDHAGALLGLQFQGRISEGDGSEFAENHVVECRLVRRERQWLISELRIADPPPGAGR